MNTFFFFLILPLSLSFAAGTNRTIDDGLGDTVTGLQVEYLPLNSPNNTAEPFWKHEDQCNGCAILPDRTKAFDKTWTATTYFPAIEYMSIGFRFNGTTIYIYLILSNYPANTSLVSRTVCNFRLDGSIVGGFRHETDDTMNFDYNTLAYSNNSLGDEEHIFLIETTGSDSSYVAFDYAIYTFNSNSQTSPPSRELSGGAVAGIVIGILVFVAVLTCGTYIIYCRRSRSSNNTEGNIHTGKILPFTIFLPSHRNATSMHIARTPLHVQVEATESSFTVPRGKRVEGQSAARRVQMERSEERQYGSSQGSRCPGSLPPMDDGSTSLRPLQREDVDAPPRYTEYHLYSPSDAP